MEPVIGGCVRVLWMGDVDCVLRMGAVDKVCDWGL